MLSELVAGFDSELAEGFTEVIVDGAGADEHLCGDLLVGRSLGREAGDLCFLGGKLIFVGLQTGWVHGRSRLLPSAAEGCRQRPDGRADS